jgi:hypothetical protein
MFHHPPARQESALRLNYESVGGAEGHMTQKIDLNIGRAEVLVLELPALFSALGQLRQVLNAALGTFQVQNSKTLS